MKSQRVLIIAILLSMFVWGMSWSSAKVLSSYGSAASIAFIRFALTIITLAVILSIIRYDFRIKRNGWGYVAGAGVLMFAYALLFFRGLQLGMPGAGGVLVTTMNPLFAYLIGLVVSRIYPRKSELIGLLIGVAAGGVLLRLWATGERVFDSGNSYFLMGACVWAGMSKFSSHAYRFGNSISFSMWMHLVALVGLGYVADLNEVWAILKNGDAKFYWNMSYFGIINSGLATTCFLYASAKIGPEKASTFIFVVPAMAVMGAWVFMGEVIQWHTIVGGLMGILAVFIINRRMDR